MNQELDVWDSLLIRACKSNKISIRRFRKIWAMRCDLYYDYTDMADVTQHLIELIRTEEAVLDTVIQVIRHTEVVKLPGFRSPTRFLKRRTES